MDRTGNDAMDACSVDSDEGVQPTKSGFRRVRGLTDRALISL